ncbi:hypothetical protein CCHR01_08035 [Colletotrichum chrysophilum]|uniref:Uncharacterized protein n=1 Tax=Colletotrichum chrysophilum TaxID=1836956 RepID=A0AAD9AJY9_9PEZI|nr:hypothetical protein CCHR01_08035 [Colletotrichum chrysophilum]
MNVARHFILDSRPSTCCLKTNLSSDIQILHLGEEIKVVGEPHVAAALVHLRQVPERGSAC